MSQPTDPLPPYIEFDANTNVTNSTTKLKPQLAISPAIRLIKRQPAVPPTIKLVVRPNPKPLETISCIFCHKTFTRRGTMGVISMSTSSVPTVVQCHALVLNAEILA
jgi:hypothetical protein